MKITGNFFIVSCVETIAEGMTLAEKNGIPRYIHFLDHYAGDPKKLWAIFPHLRGMHNTDSVAFIRSIPTAARQYALHCNRLMEFVHHCRMCHISAPSELFPL